MIHPNCYHDHSDISGDELPLTTSNERNGVKIRLGPSRFAALPPVTIIETLDRIVGKYGEKPALHQKQFPPGKLSKDTPWKTWTWKEYQSISYMFAKSLIFLDLQPFDTVTIVGFNAPEWIFANIGAIAAGGIAAGIYATETPDRCKCICTYSKARVAVVGGIDQLNKFVEIASDLPFLMAIVIYGGDTVPECLQHKCVVPIYCFDVFLELGMRVSDSHLRELTSLQKPNHVCMLSFTSGTTGPAKACMITHDNVTWTSKAILATLPRRVDERDCAVSYLPLANSSAQVMNLYIPLLSGSQTFFVQRGAVLSSVFETLREVRPSVFLGPPRVWERICSKLKESEASGMRGKALQWAKEKALRHHASKQYKSNVSSPLLYPLAKLLLHRLRVMIGLDRCMVAYCSSSPISLGTLEYFASLDIPIYEVYGQTECTGPHTANSPGRAWKMGTSGRPLLGTESKIDDSGEVCFRGRHVFAGYLRMEETTAATIDSEGWLHSGDMGYFDKDDDPRVAPPSGFLTITGRIKEEITIDTGEIVSPVSIEQNILDAMPAVANCMVVGDGCHFLSVLLCLFTDVSDCSGPTNKLIGKSLEASRAIGSTATTPVEAQRCEKWNEYFKKGIQVANQKATAQANSVRKWEVVPVKFSIEGGELTPTLKLKRKYTEAKYSSLVEALYS